jgi:hypothetical protein
MCRWYNSSLGLLLTAEDSGHTWPTQQILYNKLLSGYFIKVRLAGNSSSHVTSGARESLIRFPLRPLS